MGGRTGEAGITGNQGSAEFVGEGYVDRVVGRQIMPHPPNIWQENEVRIACQTQAQ